MISKKAQLGSLQIIITTLVVVGILIGVGFLVLEEFLGQMTAGSDAYDGVNSTIQAMKKVPTFLSIIVIISVVGILLAIVFAVLPRAQGA